MKKKIKKINRYISLKKLTYDMAIISWLIGVVLALIKGLTFGENKLASLLVILPVIFYLTSFIFRMLVQESIRKLKEELIELRPKNKYKIFLSEEKSFYTDENKNDIAIVENDNAISIIDIPFEDIAEVFD